MAVLPTPASAVQVTHALTVDVDGNGGGNVTSSPPGIDCGWDGFDCFEEYDEGTVVTLTAAPVPGATFEGWSGGCAGTGGCVVTMTADTSVTATFAALTLAVTLHGDGTGTVTSSPPGIDCGFDCEEWFEPGTEVTLTATPAAEAMFVGWSGDCTGTGECVVTMTADTEVGATFDAFILTATIGGDGSGEVESSPPGIHCFPGGYDCSEPYAPGTVVTLTATPAAKSAFTGWSGACAGTGTCEVTVTGDLTVTASFDTSRLYVTKAGDGLGTITSSPAGISCPGDCLEAYVPGTEVTLTAAPGAKAVFTGWSGACEGTGSCVVTMDEERSVTATFDTSHLTVSRDGLGAGTITSEPPGIECGLDCGEAYLPAPVEVTLTATPQAGSTFAGWTGDCTGTGTCVLTMDVDRVVAATFNPPGVGGKIVYECVADICVVDEDGSNKVNLTNSLGVQDYEPELSADGTKIVFRSNGDLTDNADRNYEIVTMNIDGSGIYQVTSTTGPPHNPHDNYEPAWSPDGTKIAFSSHRTSPTFRQIFTINPDGTGETMLTDPSDYVERLNPAWSPDGTKIAFTWTLGYGDIYVMNPDGSNQVNLTPGTPGWDDVDPAWSPDGTRIAYTSDQYYDPLTFNTDIFVRNADGSAKVRVTDDIHIDKDPTWSPDGTEIAFSSTRGGNYDIWAVAAPPQGLQADPTGGPTERGLRQVTTSPGADLYPYWGKEPTFTLTVTKFGSGRGTVRSTSAGGIKCGADCSEAYAAGTVVRLIARPLGGSTFDGWSGACTGTGACRVTMDSAKTVRARFNSGTSEAHVDRLL
jgi:Tol biopolymer transport system component